MSLPRPQISLYRAYPGSPWSRPLCTLTATRSRPPPPFLVSKRWFLGVNSSKFTIIHFQRALLHKDVLYCSELGLFLRYVTLCNYITVALSWFGCCGRLAWYHHKGFLLDLKPNLRSSTNFPSHPMELSLVRPLTNPSSSPGDFMSSGRKKT